MNEIQSTTNRTCKFSVSDLKRHKAEIKSEKKVVRQEIESWLSKCGLDDVTKEGCRKYYIDGASYSALTAQYPYISNLEREVKKELGIFNSKKKKSE